MGKRIPANEANIDAGDVSVWLEAYRSGEDADVPCGACTACCEASYFIHVTPADAAARRHIPAELLFAAPGQPDGHLVMGFDEHGRCPMLQDGRCAIYPHRPQTCRDYDCRVFAATGIDAGGADKAGVNARAAQWRFRAEIKPTWLDELKQLGAWLVRQDQAPTNPTEAALLCLDVFAQLAEIDDFGEAARRDALRSCLERLNSRA